MDIDFEETLMWDGPGYSHEEQDKEDAPFVSFKLAPKIAPNDTAATMSFIRYQITSEANRWTRMCLSLQRQARALPAVYPTAISAMAATPKEERIPFDQAKRGMIGFSYDPRIPGTAGHIFSIHGKSAKGVMLTGTNDARSPGRVSIVDLGFYEREWGQKLQFAATWLNGYDFSDFNAPPVPVKEGTLGERYVDAMERIERIEHDKRKKGYDKLADALARDIARMKRKLERWGL